LNLFASTSTATAAAPQLTMPDMQAGTPAKSPGIRLSSARRQLQGNQSPPRMRRSALSSFAPANRRERVSCKAASFKIQVSACGKCLAEGMDRDQDNARYLLDNHSALASHMIDGILARL
jgi:hypothetical protein